MKASKIIQDNGLAQIRPRKGHIQGQPIEYDVRIGQQGKKKGWIYLDAFTKSAMRKVYNALSEETRKTYDNVSILKLVNFTWSVIK